MKHFYNQIRVLFFVFVGVFAMESANAQYMLYGDDIIIDGDFSADTLSSAWTPYSNSLEGGSATATFGVTDSVASITGIAGTDGTSWHVQFNQILTAEQIAAIEVGKEYELSFDARTDADSKDIAVFFGHNGGGWENYATGVTLTNTMQTFTQRVLVTATWGTDDAGMKVGFEGGFDNGSFFLDNVKLRTFSDNIVRDGSFDSDTTWTLQGTETSITDGELSFVGLTGEGNSFDVQAYQPFDQEQLDSIYVGPYSISFDARTDEGTHDIHVFIGEVGGGWARYLDPAGEGLFTLDTEMKTYTREFAVDQTWADMRIGFEVNYDAGDVFIDNVVFSRITDVVPDAPVVNLSTADGIVTIAVEDNGAASYDVFFADSAFAETGEGTFVGTIDPSTGLSITHTIQAPHPDLVLSFDAHYGVVAKSEKGSASDMTAAMINTETSVAENYIVELSEDAVNAVIAGLDNGVVPAGEALAGFFPDSYKPFEINTNSTLTEGTGADSDADLSAKFWVGFENITGSELFVIYAEIMDDVIVPAPTAADGGGGWNFDSWEGGFGSYEPESFITGSTHDAFETGDEPDYQLRAGFMAGTNPYIHGWDGDTGDFNQFIGNSATLGDSSQAGMYRLLTVISTIEFSGVNATAKDFEYPTGEEITTIPFQLAVNDNDDSGRDAQYALSPKSTSQWWNTPSEWKVVAMVGADAVFTVNDELERATPMVYTLEQNYPNPFNPSTNIQFSLPATSEVTLEVFNMLGQKVATLIDGQKLTAGSHTQKFDASSLASGMYVYRISAANFVQSRKMMLIK
jgi:hypothetical protein